MRGIQGLQIQKLIGLHVKILNHRSSSSSLPKHSNPRSSSSPIPKHSKWKPNKESVLDSPKEALRKICVSVITEYAIIMLQKASKTNTERLVRIASYSQNCKARTMEFLLKNKTCEFSTQLSFYPKLAALTTAKNFSSCIVSLFVYGCARRYEMLSDEGEISV